MTLFERMIARIGIAGLLALLLSASILANLWQFNRASKAESACNERIAKLVDDVNRKTAAQEVTALEIGRETDKAASNAVEVIEKETVRYVDRIRRETVEVPANCPRALPDGVQDALTEAARAANRPM